MQDLGDLLATKMAPTPLYPRPEATRIAGEGGTHIYHVPSKRPDGPMYTVVLTYTCFVDGEPGQALCPGYRHNGSCHHVAKTLAAIQRGGQAT